MGYCDLRQYPFVAMRIKQRDILRVSSFCYSEAMYGSVMAGGRDDVRAFPLTAE